MTAARVLGVVLAGGRGTRLWPLSRRALPKTVLRWPDGPSLLRRSVDRLGLPVDQIRVVTGRAMASAIRNELWDIAEDQVFIEPSARGTLAPVLLAVALGEREGVDVVVVTPADGHVEEPKLFEEAVDTAVALAFRHNKVGLLGMPPFAGATGLGWIVPAEAIAEEGTFPVALVKRFVEKPPEEEALRLRQDGRNRVNSGVFVIPVAGFGERLSQRDRALGALYREMVEAGADRWGRASAWAAYADEESVELDESDADAVVRDAALADARRFEAIWAQIPEQGFDRAVLEPRPDEVLVVSCDPGWSDMGTFRALTALLPRTAGGPQPH